MRIKVSFVGYLMSVKSIPSKDGSRFYYRLNVETEDEECGVLSCSEDLYRAYQNGEVQKYQKCEFFGTYNAQYNSFSVLSFNLVK